MSAPNNEPNKLHILGGMIITGIAIALGLGGLVLLYLAEEFRLGYAMSYFIKAKSISLAMIGLAILVLFFGARLIKRGGTTYIGMVGYVVLSILFSIVASPFIALLLWTILLFIYGLPGM